MTTSRPAFYALAPGGWRDYVTLLHPPYTLWHLSYVAIGAALLAGSATWWATRTTPLMPAARRLSITGLKPLVYDPFQALALSPDSTMLAFRGRGADGIDRVFLRHLGVGRMRVMGPPIRYNAISGFGLEAGASLCSGLLSFTGVVHPSAVEDVDAVGLCQDALSFGFGAGQRGA